MKLRVYMTAERIENSMQNHTNDINVRQIF